MRGKETVSRRDFLRLTGYGLAGYCFKDFIGVKQIEGIEGKTFWRDGVISSIKTEKNIYALTIDDGWFPDTMAEMLDLMKESHLSATFFLVGEAVTAVEYQKPGIIKRIVDEGHSIGYHTMHHDMEELKNENASYFKNDYIEWYKLMRYKILGQERADKGLKRYARAPYGLFTDAFVEMCQETGLQAFAWNRQQTHIRNRVKFQKGDILLLHVIPEDLALMKLAYSSRLRALTSVSLDCFAGYRCPSGIMSDAEFERLIEEHLKGVKEGRFKAY